MSGRQTLTLIAFTTIVAIILSYSLASGAEEKRKIRELEDSLSAVEDSHAAQREEYESQLAAAQVVVDTLNVVRERETAAREEARRRQREAERTASELRSDIDSLLVADTVDVEAIVGSYEALVSQKDTVIEQLETIASRLTIQLEATDSAVIALREGLARASIRVSNLEIEDRLKDEIIERQNALIHKPLFGLIPSGLKGDAALLVIGYVTGKGIEAIAN